MISVMTQDVNVTQDTYTTTEFLTVISQSL